MGLDQSDPEAGASELVNGTPLLGMSDVMWCCCFCRPSRWRGWRRRFALTGEKQRDLDARCKEATQIQLIGYDVGTFADMVLAVWGFLHAVRRDDEIMRQIDVTTVDPGPHRRPRYGAAIRTTATLEFRLWVNPVLVPVVGTGGCRGGDTHRREDESSHGIPQASGRRCLLERLCILASH